MNLNERVASHLDDMAAVEVEHGRTLVADMLTGKANILRADDLTTALMQAQEMIGNMNTHLPERIEVEGLEDLRAARQERESSKRAFEAAVARADELHAEAWLREGYSSPPESVVLSDTAGA